MAWPAPKGAASGIAWLVLMNRHSRAKMAKREAEADDGEAHGPISRLWYGLELNPSFLGESAQGGLAVAREGRAVHEGEGSRLEVGEALDGCWRTGGQARVAEQILGLDSRAEDVAFGQRRPVAQVGEEIAA